MGTVIVAIPKEDDPVWKYSSEKIPHMTLLYLGDDELRDQENTLQYIQHVAKTSLNKFGMSVERRGPLGPNEADVLFFDKGWANNDIVALRSYLLTNESIKIAHDGAEQFEGWVPHLTMGFPETPAKEDDRDYPGFNYIQFDRIAVWFDDYEGPEFLLESNDNMCVDYPGSASWSDEKSDEEVIAHADPKTVQDIMDNMLDEERAVFDLIVGAAIDGVDLSDDDETMVGYDLMSDEEKGVLSFVVGAITADDYNTDEVLKQSAIDDLAGDIIEHSGVPGMKWGVHKDKSGTSKPSSLSKSDANTRANRKEARSVVKTGKSTLGDAHKAALKSKGHRVVNGFLGDKTYWKRALVIAGVTLAGVGIVATPGLLPAAAVMSVGSGIISAGTIAGHINAVDNVVRAVRGNARINKSYDSLGTKVHDTIQSGDTKVKKTLGINGGIRNKFLNDIKAPDKTNSVKHSALEDLVADILSPKVLEQSAFDNLIDDILEHSGVKGMRWGYRRKVDSSGLVTGAVPKNPKGGGPGGSTAAPAGSADHERAIVALAKKNEQGVHALSNQDLKDINNRMKALDEFQKAMTPKEKSDLQKRVEDLRLQKELRQLEAENRVANQSAGAKLVKSMVANGGKVLVDNVAKEMGIYGKNFVDDMVGNTRKAEEKKLREKAAEQMAKEREERRQDLRDEAKQRRKDVRDSMKDDHAYAKSEARRRQREAEDEAKRKRDTHVTMTRGSDGVYR